MRPKITENNSIFIMVDIQEKFRNVIFEMDNIIKNADILNKASEILEIPLIITEQYPKGLGSTISDIHQPDTAIRLEKTVFSTFTPEFLTHIGRLARPYLVFYGVEAHICLTQSALDAKAHGYEVLYVCDAVSSRDPYNKQIAIERLIQNKVEMVSTEMLLFELVNDAKHPKFKAISALIK